MDTTNPRRRARTDQKLAQRKAMGRRWREADVRAQERAADLHLGVSQAWRRWLASEAVDAGTCSH